MGYHRAGFDVVGVDIEPQPHYPFEFIQGDALKWLRWGCGRPIADDFDAIHASPPCQAYSTMGNRSRAEGKRKLGPAPDLLEPTWALLRETGLPYVMENVAGAKALMPNAVVLSGAMFGLGVHRPRYFVSNVLLLTPPPHKPPPHGIGVYGRDHDGRRLFNRKSNGTYRAPRTLAEAQQAMGMDWADWHGTKEAIPPAYTEYIGRQAPWPMSSCRNVIQPHRPGHRPRRPLLAAHRLRRAGGVAVTTLVPTMPTSRRAWCRPALPRRSWRAAPRSTTRPCCGTRPLVAQHWRRNGTGTGPRKVKSSRPKCSLKSNWVNGSDPNPEAGNRYVSQDLDIACDIYDLIPQPRVSELQRYLGHRDFLVGLVREGKRSRRSLLLELDRANAVDVEASDVEITAGDFREVLDVEPGSVALVLTDPPYPAEYLPLWSDLGQWSVDWLVPGGSLVAYCGQANLYEAHARLSGHLRYWWTLALTHGHGTAMMIGKNVSVGWKPLLWFVRDAQAQ